MPGSGPAAVAAQLRLVGRFLDEVVGEPVTLVGHSLGGVLALLHAATHPVGVEGLVLLSPPTPRPTALPVDPVLTARLALLRTPGVAAVVRRTAARRTPAELVTAQLQRATPHRDRIPPDAVAAATTEATERTRRSDAAAADAAQWQAILGVVARFTRPRAWRRTVAQVTAPTLWLHGQDDPLAPIAPAQALAATRPDWPFVVLPGVGHLPHLENATAVAERLLPWLLHRPGDSVSGTR